MKHILLFVFVTQILLSQQDNFPKREFRGVWIATVANLDWPSNRDTNSSQQTAELDTLLTRLKSIGFNAVMFQIRPECDAFYASSFEPWSYWITGVQGKSPSQAFDPLKHGITTAHKLGMELHAWFNPFRAERSVGLYPLAKNHVVNTHPEWILTMNNSIRMLNPGLPEVRLYIASIVADVVRRYDIDGVHWDDYFYPYAPNSITTQDDSSYSRFNSENLNKADWRRNNVNKLVKLVSDSIKSIKPWVKFGISPFGVWKSDKPNKTSAYENLYNDAVFWMQQHYLDYLTPQLYWQIGSSNDYAKLLSWWKTQINGRFLYPGQAVYRINESDWSASEILNQVRLNRIVLKNPGNIFFRSTLGVLNNPKGLADSLKNDFFRYPAFVPQMLWLDSIPPLPPVNISGTYQSNRVNIRWEKPSAASDGDTVRSYVIYRSMLPDTVDAREVRQILTVANDFVTEFIDTNLVQGAVYSYAVTSMDKMYNESDIAEKVTVAIMKPEEKITLVPDFLYTSTYSDSLEQWGTIRFTFFGEGHTSIILYDLYGREIAVLIDGIFEKKQYSCKLIVNNIPEGTYVYYIATDTTYKNGKLFIRYSSLSSH